MDTGMLCEWCGGYGSLHWLNLIAILTPTLSVM